MLCIYYYPLNFPSAENDTNIFIEFFTLRDALRFRICIAKYPLSQIKFLCKNYCCVLCDSRVREKPVNKILAFGHILKLLRVHTHTGFQAAKVLITTITCKSIKYSLFHTKLIELMIFIRQYINFTQCFNNY